MRRILPNVGAVYGEWTFLGQVSKRRWFCRCSCGREAWVQGEHLRTGRSKSCHGKLRTTHGQTGTKLYASWHYVKHRVQREPHYRQLGIYEPWKTSFEAFASELGEPPSLLHSVERKDNSRGYFPGNVIWATSAEQSRNRRSNRWLVIDGLEATLTDWCAFTGVNTATATNRIKHYGCTPAQAVGLEPLPWANKGTSI